MMTAAEFDTMWRRIDAQATAKKDSNQALIRLKDLYASFDAADRQIVDTVLSEWVLLDLNSRRRFDALALIQHFRIRAALPAVLKARCDLKGATDPSVPFEDDRLRRIGESLSR